MWTIRIRWKRLYEIFVCSWNQHDWDEYFVNHPGYDRPGYFCKLCRTERPKNLGGTEHTPEGMYRWYQEVTPDGQPLGRRIITGTNIAGMKLG